MIKRLAANSLLICTLIGCASFQSEIERPIVLYSCSAKAELEHGRISTTRWIYSNKTHNDVVMVWYPFLGETKKLRTWVRWDAASSTEVDWKRGLFMADYRIPRRNKKSKAKRGLSMELRVQSSEPWQGYAAVRGTQKLQDGVRLSADWSDVRAMAAGSEQLFLIVRDKKFNILDTIDLPKGAFAIPTEDIQRLVNRTKDMTKAPDIECEDYSDDSIIVI